LSFQVFAGGAAVLLPLLSGGPVNHAVGDFLPLATLGAEVTHAVALNLPVIGGLIRTVLQDEPFGMALRDKRGAWEGSGAERGIGDEQDGEAFQHLCNCKMRNKTRKSQGSCRGSELQELYSPRRRLCCDSVRGTTERRACRTSGESLKRDRDLMWARVR